MISSTRARNFQAGRSRPQRMSLSEALKERLEVEKRDREGTEISFFDWAMRAPEPKTGTLDFKRFPFQLELYKEGVNELDARVMKSTQVGVSAFGVRWSLFHTDTKGLTGLYIFPTQRDVYDFSTARIKPVIDGSAYLRSRQQPDDPDNKGMKGLGLGLIYFRGSESKRGLDSVDADHIVFDEYDTLTQDNIPDAERRITGSLHGLVRRVGVPSIPDWGIAKLYDESDQREWHVKCSACGEWQTIDFFENVDQVKLLRICRKCGKPVEVGTGEWVAKYPDRENRGYHINRLIAPLANIGSIVKASKKRAPYERQVFFNKDLGLPYAPAEGRLSKEAIAAAQSAGGGYALAPGYVGSNPVTMGVDVASTRNLNVRVSEHFAEGKKRALFIGEVEDFTELDAIFNRFQVNMACIDHLPEGRLARAWAERHPGQIYLVAYDTTPTPKTADVIKVDDDMRFVQVRRVEAIDAMTEMIRTQKNHLPIDLPEGYVGHLQALVRTSEQDELGKVTVVYRKTAEDDYAHAEVYDIVATGLWWRRQGLEELEEDVYTPLDDMIEFERSHLGDYEGDDRVYGSGERDDDEYRV